MLLVASRCRKKLIIDLMRLYAAIGIGLSLAKGACNPSWALSGAAMSEVQDFAKKEAMWLWGSS